MRRSSLLILPVSPENLIGMTRGWAYGNEAANGRLSDPVAAENLISGKGLGSDGSSESGQREVCGWRT
jgi:hypothetical protein